MQFPSVATKVKKDGKYYDLFVFDFSGYLCDNVLDWNTKSKSGTKG